MSNHLVPNLELESFGENQAHFWVGSTERLLQQFPFLEFSHIATFFAIFIIEEGEGFLQIDSQKVRVEGQKIVFIKPGNIFKVDLSPSTKGYFIVFTDNFFSLRYNNNILHNFSFLKSDVQSFLRISEENERKLYVLLTFIKEEFDLRQRETYKVLRSYLNIVLFEIERMFKPFEMPKHKSIQQEKVLEFERLIDLHFERLKLPSQYAEMLHVTPGYLNKICKEVCNQTAGYLIRKRILMEAQRLLFYTNYSINEIATKLGFEHAPYFNTLFKKEIGVSPEKYRKTQS